MVKELTRGMRCMYVYGSCVDLVLDDLCVLLCVYVCFSLSFIVVNICTNVCTDVCMYGCMCVYCARVTQPSFGPPSMVVWIVCGSCLSRGATRMPSAMTYVNSDTTRTDHASPV